MEVGKDVTSSPRPRRRWPHTVAARITCGCSLECIRLQPGLHRHRVASPRRRRRRKYGSSHMSLTTHLLPTCSLHRWAYGCSLDHIRLQPGVHVTHYLLRTCSLSQVEKQVRAIATKGKMVGVSGTCWCVAICAPGCNHMYSGLQPYAVQPATGCTPACNRMHSSLQPYAL